MWILLVSLRFFTEYDRQKYPDTDQPYGKTQFINDDYGEALTGYNINRLFRWLLKKARFEKLAITEVVTHIDLFMREWNRKG